LITQKVKIRRNDIDSAKFKELPEMLEKLKCLGIVEIIESEKFRALFLIYDECYVLYVDSAPTLPRWHPTTLIFTLSDIYGMYMNEVSNKWVMKIRCDATGKPFTYVKEYEEVYISPYKGIGIHMTDAKLKEALLHSVREDTW